MFCVHPPVASNTLFVIAVPDKANEVESAVAVSFMPESVNFDTQLVKTGPVVLRVTVMMLGAQGPRSFDAMDEEALKANARICSGWASPLALLQAVRLFQAVSSRDDSSAGSPMETTVWVVGS